MARGPALSIVGSMALVGLAACGKSWFEEREPWRHEAEEACLKGGSVKESANAFGSSVKNFFTRLFTN